MTDGTATATPTVERGANVDDAAEYLDSLDLFGLKPPPESDDDMDTGPVAEDAPEPEDEPEPEEAEVDEDDEPSDDDSDDDVVSAEDRTLTLEAIAAQLEVDVDDLYNLELATKIDGKEGKATLRDLQKSYQLQKHINAKSEEASTLKKQAEEFRTKAEQELMAEKKRAIDLVREHLMGEYTQVDWDNLKQDDPDRYAQKWIEFQQKERDFNRQIEDYNQRLTAQQQEQQAQVQQYLSQQQQKLYEIVPQWSDETVKKQEQEQIRSYLKDHGFADEEMGIYDARYVAILRDAAKFRELQKSKPSVTKKANQAGRVVKPGPRRPAPKKSQEKVDAFMKSRDLRSAADLLASMDI